MGCTWVSVVSRLASVFAVTRLPSDCSDRPVMPAMGAVTRVYERLSSASLSFASAEAIEAAACFAVATRRVEVALRDRLLPREGLEALGVGFGELVAHALLQQRGPGVLHGELVGRRVDQEERLAGLHRARLPRTGASRGCRSPGRGSAPRASPRPGPRFQRDGDVLRVHLHRGDRQGRGAPAPGVSGAGGLLPGAGGKQQQAGDAGNDGAWTRERRQVHRGAGREVGRTADGLLYTSLNVCKSGSGCAGRRQRRHAPARTSWRRRSPASTATGSPTRRSSRSRARPG